MIELVLPDTSMIDIMREAGDEVIAVGNRWDLKERNAMAENQVSQQPDVEIKRRSISMIDRLTIGEEQTDLLKEIKTNSKACLRSIGNCEGDAVFRCLIHKNRRRASA